MKIYYVHYVIESLHHMNELEIGRPVDSSCDIGIETG